MDSWLDEIDLDVTGPPVSMGIRKLGNRPWTFTDAFTNDELTLKLQLSEDISKEVFIATNETELAGKAVLELLKKSGVKVLNSHSGHSLEKAGLSVQEDLCLMNRTSEGWILKAASLCFPSRWQLREKIGKNMIHIHGPVEGYEEHLSKRVNNFFDRLGNEPVWRRNWFIHPDNSLYQPQPPLNGDPIIKFNEIGKKLFVRSERQTLQHLEIPGWILFTIRVQRTPLQNLLVRRKEEFAEWVFKAPESHHQHKGLRPEQTQELQKSLK